MQFDDQTIMQGARFPEEQLDVLIVETTRGDRATPQGFTRDGEELRFAQAIKAAFDRRRRGAHPAFLALGKTQEILAMFYGIPAQRTPRPRSHLYRRPRDEAVGNLRQARPASPAATPGPAASP
ncbi:MAG: hypothetical protein WDN28_09565 [Chthoniobacter sp.]